MNQTPNSPDIPIIFCKTCNKAPMIAKTFNQHLRGKDGIDIEFECPRCGATTTEKVPGVNPEVASKTD
jgi:RNase P subunit RPR2